MAGGGRIVAGARQPILIATTPVDFRCGHQALALMVQTELKREPHSDVTVISTLKEQCIHRHRLESIQQATRVIGDWIRFYNHRRPHQALAMRTPAEAFRLAA